MENGAADTRERLNPGGWICFSVFYFPISTFCLEEAL